jgi:hypothetical protein
MNIVTKIKQFSMLVRVVLGLVSVVALMGCEDYLEIDDPTAQISTGNVFENKSTATAAITTLYAKLRDEVLVTGSTAGVGVQMGLYADELAYYGSPTQPLNFFYEHQIMSSDATISGVWNRSYNLIHLANAAIDGLNASASLEENVRRQLLGEALFVRALVHFYLVNLFGDVPYVTSTDFEVNSTVARKNKLLVYSDIMMDLTQAKENLGEAYPTNERVRANKAVASALLARVYLYLELWEMAEAESSLLLNNSSVYSLPALVDNEFLKASPSAILQLKTKVATASAAEATAYNFVTGPPPLIALRNDFITHFEGNDQRRLHWVGEVANSGGTWYFSRKYKQGVNTQYSVVFRLAEQYLIRAEARLNQNNTAGALQDINTIRQRAGLPNTLATTQAEIKEALVKERLTELFTEHGHRWFDLVRWGKAAEVISPIKPAWQSTDVLFPIPETELSMNPNLQPQNPGY